MSEYSIFMIDIQCVLTFDQALDDSRHFNTTLDDRNL